MSSFKKGGIIILSSPSGAGKTTLVKKISKIPSARLGERDDIANAVLFLCSSHSNYINGETLHVNGGMYFS